MGAGEEIVAVFVGDAVDGIFVGNEVGVKVGGFVAVGEAVIVQVTVGVRVVIVEGVKLG